MAKAATAAELRGLSRSELNTKVTELKEELFTPPLSGGHRSARVARPAPRRTQRHRADLHGADRARARHHR